MIQFTTKGSTAPQTGLESRRGKRRPRVLAGVLAMAGAALLLPFTTTNAGAAVIEAQGAAGWVSSGQTNCYYYNYSGKLVTSTAPPTVYAYNRYAGGGNDWQQVRYRIVWYYGSGQVRSVSGWSGVAWAADNQPAVWSGSPTAVSWRYDDKVKVGTEIVYYDRNGVYEGHAVDLANSYQNYQEGSRAGVSYDYCRSHYGTIY